MTQLTCLVAMKCIRTLGKIGTPGFHFSEQNMDFLISNGNAIFLVKKGQNFFAS